MKRTILILSVIAWASVAWAQAGSGSAAGTAADPAPPAPPPPPTAAPSTEELRKTCVAAMNADKTFADSIVKQAKELSCVDADVLKAHQDAQHHVQKNQRQVVLAYALMWVVAAGFVVFLWRRQLALKAEIGQLRRDLDAAGKDGK